MRKLFCLAFVCGVGLATWAGADPPRDQPAPRPNVEQLIRRLGDEDHRQREAASKALRDMGPEVLPQLRKALADADAEVRRRAGEIIPALETSGALAPMAVNLDVEQQTIPQILEELTRSTGYKYQQWGGNNQQSYTFHLHKVPFWRAIDEVSQTCGLVLQQGYGDEWLRFQQIDAVVPHVWYDGAFRFVANSFQYYRTINFSSLPKTGAPSAPSESLTFSFSVFSEPKLPLLGIGQAIIETAYDQDKRSLIPPPSGPNGGTTSYRQYSGSSRMYCQQTSITLTRPSERSRTLKYLKGTLPVTVLLEQKPEVVTDNILGAKGKNFKAGDVRFSVEEATETPGPIYQIKMSLVNEDAKATPNDYTWQNSLHQRIELHDAEGNKFQINGSSWGGGGVGQVQMTLNYTPPANVKAGKPTKLIYYSWKTLQHQVGFEFKDLPLP